MKIAFETHPNKALLTIHTNMRMPKIEVFKSHFLTNDARVLKKMLLGIDGVQGITARNYEVRIKRVAVFTFEELKPKIIKALEDYSRDIIDQEVQPYA
jgi:hypothetical protein